MNQLNLFYSNYYPWGFLDFPYEEETPGKYIVTHKDKEILRKLANKISQISEMPTHNEKIKLWKDLNGLRETRPLVWINEIPWHEMDVDNKLSLKTETRFANFLETRLRITLYLWKHMPADMVVKHILSYFNVIEDSGFGIIDNINVAKTDEKSTIISRQFIPQIKNEDDLEKIKVPKITFNKEAPDLQFQSMMDIFNGILKIETKDIMQVVFLLLTC